MKKQLTIAALALAICSCNQGGQASKQSFNSSADYPEWQYTELKNEVKKGWNSWDTRNVFTQVFFPELNGVKLALVDAKGNVNDRIRVGNREEDAAIVHPYDHTYDGTYSEVDATWHGNAVKLRCSADGKRLIMLVTPTQEGNSGSIQIHPDPSMQDMERYPSRGFMDRPA